MKRFQGWCLQLNPSGCACGQISAERLAPLLQVFDLWAILARMNERKGVNALFWNIQIKAICEIKKLVFVQLFLLMRDVLAFACLAESVALHRLREDDRRLPLVLQRALVRVVHLERIMSPATKACDLIVALIFDELEQLGIFAEEFFPRIRTAPSLEVLVFAVYAFFHPLQQQTGGVARQQFVPVPAPNDFDHVPTGT